MNGRNTAPNVNSFTFAAPNTGAITFLLPYIEQDNIYRQIVAVDQRYTNVDETNLNIGWYSNATLITLARTKIKSLVCPSDNPESSQTGTFVCFYAQYNTFTGGYMPNSSGGNLLGRTNYVGNAGSIGVSSLVPYGTYEGPLGNRTKKTIVNCIDGSSNTIIFGEALGGASAGTRDYSIAWMGSGAFATAWGTTAGTSQWYQMGSKHSGVTQMAYGDGSVRSVRKGVGQTFFSNDWYNFMRASGHQDGQVLDLANIGS
jgi:hypothetical protein